MDNKRFTNAPHNLCVRKMMFLLRTFVVFVGLVFCAAMTVYGENTAGFSTIRLTSELDPFTAQRELWHNAQITVESNILEFSLHNTDILLRGRGNTTWWFGPDKRPLRFRFYEPREMLGFGSAHRDWILLANHFDRSLLRNYTALHLGRLLDGLDNTPRCSFVHLYVNGQYMGVYQLTDERDLGVGRTDLRLHENPAISEYMLEWDSRMRDEPDEGLHWVLTSTDIPFEIRFPSGNASSYAHAEYVLDYLERVSHALRSGNFEEFKNLVDIPSFVDFYLVQEFTKNPDVHFSSVFMTIRWHGGERRLVLGPLWDFDLAAGGSRMASPEEYDYSPYGITAAARNYWFRYAMKMPEFAVIVARRWDELRQYEIYNTIRRIEFLQRRYAADFNRNFERHRIMGTRVWDEPDGIVGITTHAGQVAHLVDWLERRAIWLDGHFGAIYEPAIRTWADILRSFVNHIRQNAYNFKTKWRNAIWTAC